MGEHFSIKDFIISLGLVSTTIILTFLPLFGIVESEEDGGSSVYSILITIINASALLLIVAHELYHGKEAKRGSRIWYIGMPIIVVWLYLFDHIFHYDMTKASYRIFFFFFPNSVPGIYIANYVYRYDKIKVLIRNFEPFFILGTIGLILSVPSMYSLSYTAQLSSGGGHLTISYCSALFCSYFIINKLAKDDFRYSVFNTRWCNVMETIFIPCLLVICIMGGGRGGALLLMVNFILILLLFFRKKIFKLASYILLFGILLFLFLNIFKNSELLESFMSGFERSFAYFDESGVDLSQTSGRDHVYSDMIRFIEESPILGYGFFYCYDLCFLKVDMPYPHNLFLEALLQGGIIYFLPFTIVLIKILRFSYLYVKYVNIYFLPLLTYPIVVLMFSGSYMKMCLFWFLVVYALNESKYKYRI